MVAQLETLAQLDPLLKYRVMSTSVIGAKLEATRLFAVESTLKMTFLLATMYLSSTTDTQNQLHMMAS